MCVYQFPLSLLAPTPPYLTNAFSVPRLPSERAIDLMPPHQDSMVCLVDYRSATLKTTPSIANARHFLSIVQNHYVETLGRAIVVNLPFLLTFFYKAISPFLDPVTRDKVRSLNVLGWG